jgi:aminopeptidase-like protein
MQKTTPIPNLSGSESWEQPPTAGIEMYSLIYDLYPICRSITGEGLRTSLHRIQQEVPMVQRETPSGTAVFDWVVPKEWNVRDAWVKNARGEKVIDFKRSNLHLLNYSVPIHRKMSLAELKRNLHTLPEHPNWIPYRTSYYKENWGFCLSQRQLDALEEGEYEVLIDSTLENGSLTYGESFLPGFSSDEVLLSCHCCHPSLCNDNLSGMALAAYLVKYLQTRHLYYSYRFLFVPGTIGAITWLAQNEQYLGRIKHGLVVACVGDSGAFTYKKSRRGDAEIDLTVQQVLEQSGLPYAIQEFTPFGYDERQYCSPGFNLPVGSLTRTPYGAFPQYHTSADNLDFISSENMATSFAMYINVLAQLEQNGWFYYRLKELEERNRSGKANEDAEGVGGGRQMQIEIGRRRYLNTKPKCEPQLGRRGLYGVFGGHKEQKLQEMAMLWLLNFSDGHHTLLDIAKRSNIDVNVLRTVASILCEHDLLLDA